MYNRHLIYNNLKKRYLALLLILFTVTAFGQSNFYRLSLGGGAGGTYSFTDVKSKPAYAGVINLDYHFTPFITAGLEFQTGLIKGGDREVSPNKEFTNGFMAYSLNAKFRAGEFTDFYYSNFLNYTKGFYIGTGLGVIQNNMNSIVRTKIEKNGSLYTFPGYDKSNNFLIPVNLGIDFYFPDGWGDIRYIVNINYQANLTFGEGLDGYDDTLTIRKNIGSPPDIYNFFSFGVKYTFGPKGLTGKSIR